MYDVIVVGAGPAGSVAASVLAKQGSQVLLLDKAVFPRDKVCGDDIGRGSIQLLSRLGLPFALEPEKRNCFSIEKLKVVSSTGTIFETAFPNKNGFRHQSYIIPRREFDRILWEFALQQGAGFEHLCVTEPIIKNGVVCGVRGQIDGKVVERYAKIIIAADGARSIVAKFLHPRKVPSRHYGVAMRAYLKGMQKLDHCIEFYFFTDIIGYGWIFPVNDETANIGIGSRLDLLGKDAKSLSQLFERFIHDPRVKERIPKSMLIGERRGWSLAFASQPMQRAYAGALLVGDAGAFVNPLTGAGIYNALETGRIAAEVAVEAIQRNDWSLDELRKFELRWRSVLGKGLMVGTLLKPLLSRPAALELLIRQMQLSSRFTRFILSKF